MTEQLAIPPTMRCAVLEAPGQVSLSERAVPRPGEGEILLRMTACGICSSDAIDWYVARKAPFVFGHEPVGRIAALGPGVEGLRPGQRVFVHHHAPCGGCASCRRGEPVHCETWRRAALRPGGMSEFAAVAPQAVAGDTLVLPEDVDDLAATLIEPVACAIKALRRGRLQAGERVFVVGLGFMGRILARLARDAGAAAVAGSDPLSDRRASAAAFLDAAYAPEETAPERVAADLGARPDLVIVTPPAPEAVRQGLDLARNGGRVVLFAPTPVDEEVPLPLGELFFREVDLLSSYSAGPADTRAALAAVRRGVIGASEPGVRVLPLTRVAEAYRLVKHPDVLKVIVRIRRHPP